MASTQAKDGMPPQANDDHMDGFIQRVRDVLVSRQQEYLGNPMPAWEPVDITSTTPEDLPEALAPHAPHPAQILHSLRALDACVSRLVRIAGRPDRLCDHMGEPVIYPSTLTLPLPLSTAILLPTPSQEAVQRFHRVIRSRCTDRENVRALLALTAGARNEYDVDVCDLTLRGRTDLVGPSGYTAWVKESTEWRNCGMLYPLAVAARHLPRLSSWLTPEQADTGVGKAFGNVLDTIYRGTPLSSQRTGGAIQALLDRWHDTEPVASQARDTLIHKLDIACVQMGVKSNGTPRYPRGFSLESSLAAFASAFPSDDMFDVHSRNSHAWRHLASRVQTAFPPSQLYTRQLPHGAPTWGFTRLTMRATPDTTGRRVLPPYSLHLAERTIDAVHPDPHSHTTPRTTLATVLGNLGSIALSPEVASVMMPTPEANSSRDPTHPRQVLAHMCTLSTPTLADHASYNATIMRLEASALSGTIPASHPDTDQTPRTFLMWRLDSPCAAFAPLHPEAHTARLSANGTLTQIARIAGKPPAAGGAWVTATNEREACPGDWARRLVADHLAADLHTHPANTVSAHEDGAPLRTAGLAAAAVCLTTPAPQRMVTTSPAGTQQRWAQDGIDPRYASVETSGNGYRLRDWVAIHCDASSGHTWQARLAVHVITVGGMHSAIVPWSRSDGETVPVRIQSTLPLEHASLSGPDLATAIEAHIRGSPQHIPTRKPGAKVNPRDMEFYHPHPGLSMLAYTTRQPVGDTELVIFQTETHIQ